MAKTLADISEAMRDIDFCILSTRTAEGAIDGRPMSNNRDVDYTGTSRFFSYEGRPTVNEIDRDPNIGVSYVGNPGLKGLIGAPGSFIHVEGQAEVVRDKARLAEHWSRGLDRWFPQGADTPGAVMIEVRASRVRYWSGGEDGEIDLRV